MIAVAEERVKDGYLQCYQCNTCKSVQRKISNSSHWTMDSTDYPKMIFALEKGKNPSTEYRIPEGTRFIRLYSDGTFAEENEGTHFRNLPVIHRCFGL